MRAQGEASGHAGGARNTTAQRMALTSLVTALKDLPSGHIHIHTTNTALARLTAKIAAGHPLTDKETPTEDLDLWAALTTALKRHPPTFTLADPATDPAAAFAQAWADLAMDKAKAAGPFTAAIPKPNLAKLKL